MPVNPSPLARAARRLALPVVAALAAGCASVADPDRPSADLCPQTYEFGNHGCARVVVVFDEPAGPLPPRYLYSVRARSARPDAGDVGTFAPDPAPGAVPLQVTLWLPLPPAASDTLSMWVVAALLEDPQPAVVNVPLPVVAADSALRLLRFAPVGAVPRTDTVRLTLRRR